MKMLFTAYNLKTKTKSLYNALTPLLPSIPQIATVENVPSSELSVIITKSNHPPYFWQVLRFWQARVARLRRLREQVAEVILELTNTYCQMCRSRWGLRPEVVQGYEELYF